MGVPLGAAARDYATRRLTVIWLLLSALLGISALIAPSEAQAQATCSIDFSVPYNSAPYNHVMSMTQNFDEFSACDTNYIANPGSPSSGFAPYSQSGATAGGGSYQTTVNTADDTLTYTAPANFSGTDTFTVWFCNDNIGCHVANNRLATVTVTVDPPTLSMTPAPGALAGGTVATAYPAVTLTASGSASPYAFTVSSGSLPPGLSLGTVTSPTGTSSTVQLSGTPTTAGPYNFTIEAADSSTGTTPPDGKLRISRAYSVTIAPQQPVANPVSAIVGYGSTNNPITLNITGGTPQTVAVGTQATHGTATAVGTTISYTPTAGYGGPDSFTYTATNTAGTSAPATVTITVNPPTITVNPATLPNPVTGIFYSQTVTASGGTGPYSFSIPPGTLPTGLSIDAGTGVISGIPSGAGPSTFTVTAQDSSTGDGPYTGNRTYSVTTVAPNPPVANAASATVAYNSTNNAVTLSITGGAPTSVAVGTQASHGTATAAGLSITYTPASGYFGPDSFTYTATNDDGTSAPATVTITVNPQPPLAGVTGVTVSFNSANNNVPLNLAGGIATSVAVASPASNGTATASGTSITYTPNTGYYGPDSFTYTATNAGGTSAPATASIMVNPAAPVANDVAATVPANSTNNAVTLNITGGPPASVAVGTAAHGTATAVGTSITYTPTTGYSGPDSFTYTATNVTGTSAAATVSITVTAPTLTLSAIATTGEAATTPYLQTIIASLGTAPYVFEVTAGMLPDGLDLDETSGEISGTPTAVNTFNFTVTASDTYGATGSQAYTITIGAPTVAITAPAAGALPGATTGTAYSQSFTASGGTGTHSFSLSAGAFPTGLTLSGNTLSGTPSQSGTFNFSIVPSDGTPAGQGGPFTGAAVAYSITVADPTVTITAPAAGALPAAATGTAYSQSFTASGGNGAHIFALSAGAFPSGLSLSPAGVLSGTPNVAGTFNFSIVAADSTPAGDGGPFESAAVAYSLTVTDPTVTITSPAPGGTFDAYSSTSFSQTFAATGGQSPHKFTLSGSLPSGLTLTEGGVLSGTVTETGIFNFTVTATDATPSLDGGPFSSSAASYTLTAHDDTPPTFDTFPDDITVEVDPPLTGSVVSWTVPTASDNLPGATVTQTTGLASGATFPLGPTVITYIAEDAAGNEVTDSFTVTVVQRAQGRVTMVVNTTVDGTFSFSSPETPLNFAVATSSGSGSSGAINVNPGTFPISFSVPQSFDVAKAACSDGVSTIDPKTRSGSITVVSGVQVTCTLSASDISKTTGLIGQFLEARSQLILTNGPDSTRRIERLTGNYSGQGGVSGFGMSFGGDMLPFGLRFTERDASFSYSLRRAMATDEKSEEEGALAFDGLYADRIGADAPINPFDIWVEGKFARFNAEGGDGNFGILHAGADYLVTPGLLLGLGGQLDWTDMEGEDDAEMDGFGYMIGPYLTARLSENFFFDARAAWGQSYNTVSPFGTYEDEVDATRWLISGALIGRFDFDQFTIQPKAEVAYFEEKSEEYEDSLGFDIPSIKASTGTFTFGPRVSTQMELNDFTRVEPFVTLEGIWTFAQENTATTVAESPGLEDKGLRGRGELGFTLFGGGSSSLSASGFYDGLGSSDFEAWGGEIQLKQEF